MFSWMGRQFAALLEFLKLHELQLQRLAPVTAGMFAGAMAALITLYFMWVGNKDAESAALVINPLVAMASGFFVMAFVSQWVSWGLIKTIGRIKGKAGLVEVEIDTNTSVTTTETQVDTQVSASIDGEEV